MKKTSTLLLTLFSAMALNAQQDPLYTQFWNTQQSLNPAFTGLQFKHEAHAIARQQWVGVNGAPQSQLITYGARLEQWNSGIGFTYLHDKIGFSESNQAKLNYAYHLKFQDNHSLSFGLSAGVYSYRLSAQWVPPTNSTDPSIPENQSAVDFTSDLGIAYRFKGLTTGLGITHLLNSSLNSSYQQARHYYLTAFYTFREEEKLQIRPQVLVRSDMVKISADFNTLFIMQRKYLLGLSYRTSDAIGLSAGYTFRELINLSYAYDITINKLSSISKGSHELHLGFYINKRKS